MFKRPRIGETEDDLIKQQEEFLKSSGKQVSIKRKIEENEPETSKRFIILGDIKEKPSGEFKPVEQKLGQKGFPTSFPIDLTLVQGKKGKKSLFAIQLERNRENVIEIEEGVTVEDPEIKKSHLDDRKGIHEENLEKLSKMSEDEILKKRRKLLSTLDPKLVEYLKSREKKATRKEKEKEQEVKDTKEVDEEELKQNLEKYIDSKWINMDFLEKEKLEWIGDIPDKKSLEPDQPYSARFDFKGELQPFTMEIDVRNSLYHHGDEPCRPGYTIQELYQLSRSQVLQQRILALNTLSNIIRKTKLGYYDRCFDGQLLHKLVESDIFFLLRFSVDEHRLIPSSIYCLYNLLCNESDEYCLDRLLGLNWVDEQPLLYVKLEVNKDEEKELKDHTLIGCDMIRGVLRTDLLIRLAYVMRNFSTQREVIIRVVNILIRIARHSLEAAQQILRTDLLSLVCGHIRSVAPIYEGVKLFRVLVSHSKEIALEVVRYDMEYLVTFLEAEENANISKKEFYLLKLETLYLWRGLLAYSIHVNEYRQWSQCLIRILLFYVHKVNVNHGCDFDFELYTAIVSLCNICNRKSIPPDGHIPVIMRACIYKWLTQLPRDLEKCNFALSKAFGCTFRYFPSFFKAFGVDTIDKDLIPKACKLLSTLIDSRVFNEMTSALINRSYVLYPSCVSRDPDNLPSLCTVYDGGEEFLSIAQNTSPFPFFISLVKYLKTLYRRSGNLTLLQQFVDHPNIRKYISKLQPVPYNWFMKFETDFLVGILKLLIILQDAQVLHLGFAILPLLRVDDKNAKKVFNIICESNNWGVQASYLNHLGSLYAQLLLLEPNRNYKDDLVPLDWPYKILPLLRGKEAVLPTTNILKFLNLLNTHPNLSASCSYTYRFYHLCSVFLTDSNVLEEEIQTSLEQLLSDVIANRHKVNLDLKYEKKSFYDLYTELITQYAGVSYGLPTFAKYVLFPLQNIYNVSFRKLVWFEYLHVLRVVTLSYPVDSFVDLKDFVSPCEMDESLLVAYLNSVSNKIITKKKNPFVYQVAIGNVKRFLDAENQDEKLLSFLKQKVGGLRDEEVKNDILNFDVVFNCDIDED